MLIYSYIDTIVISSIVIDESPFTRRAGGLIGAGVTGCKAPGLKTPNHHLFTALSQYL